MRSADGLVGARLRTPTAQWWWVLILSGATSGSGVVCRYESVPEWTFFGHAGYRAAASMG
jgi:hypothetical protein